MAHQQQHGGSVLCGLLEDALRNHGKPEILNCDQGTQFTSEAFTGVLKSEGVSISMDGRGRAYDNIFVERVWRSVKHEDVYLNDYASMGELLIGLTKYFSFYSTERPHQAFAKKTPKTVYQSGKGGGAVIVDKFGATDDALVEACPVALRCTDGAFGQEINEQSEENGKQKLESKSRASAVQLCDK